MAVHGGRGENIFICCQNRLAAQHRARAQLGTAVVWHLQRDTGTSPAAGTKGFLWSWRVREGKASPRSAGGTKPRGSCSGSSRFWLSFTLSTSICHYIGFFLSKGRVKYVILLTNEKCKAFASPGAMGRVVPAKPMVVCDFRVRSQNMKTSTAFPAQTAPCSPSLFCLSLIKVKLLLRADMSVRELLQLLFYVVNNGK